MSPDKPKNNDPLDATLQQSDAEIDRAAQLSVKPPTATAKSSPPIPGYKPITKIGEGAYGQVWRAVQNRTNKDVAVKIFTQRGGLDWIFLQREVERLTKLDRHPHIITLLDTDLANDPPFYVMDLVEKGSLQQFVGQGDQITNDKLIRWAHQICQALAYVHNKGLIHCDLKPANILLDEQSNVRVVDFGQSRVFTESAASLGTLYFMAPEQATIPSAGHPPQPDVRWDIYALGATLYAILIGHPPRATQKSDETLVSANTLEDRLTAYRRVIASESLDFKTPDARKIPHEFAAIIAKCLEPDHDKRYESVSDIEDDLDNLVANRPVSPLARSTTYRTKKFAQRNALRIALLVAIVVVGVSAFIAEQRKARLAPIQAQTIATHFVHDPAAACTEAESAPTIVEEHLVKLTERYLKSPAYTDRITGARAGIFLAPEAFWDSVDGGPLWQNGEWLEILELNWSDGSEPPPEPTDDGEDRPETLDANILIAQLKEKIKSGRDREKYVAYCLLGQLAGNQAGSSNGHKGLWADQHDELGNLCAEAVRTESAPGVVAAAKWAANRMGHDVDIQTSVDFYNDELTSLTFVRIPQTTSYRRGAASDDDEQLEDEARVEQGTPIDSVFVSTTEMTLATIREFFNSAASENAFFNFARTEIAGLQKSTTRDDAERTPVGCLSFRALKKYLDWMNVRVQDGPARRYRLPTESEWEYACRGGNPLRFNFGHNPKYARYFSQCNGQTATYSAADKMPNWYGLFDMHGSLWEHCDSAYEKQFVEMSGHHNVELHVVKGGAAYSPAVRCRSTQRNYGVKDMEDFWYGARLIMELQTK